MTIVRFNLINIFKRYIPYLKDFKLYFFFVFIGICLTIIANVATAHIMQPMMDKLFIAKDEDMLIKIPLLMLGIYFLKGVGRYIQSVFTTYIGQHVVTTFRTKLLNKLLFLDIAYLQNARSGEMISRIINDISRIQYFVSSMLPEFIRELFTVIALIGYVLYLNAELAFYALIVLPIVILPIAYISRKLKKISFGSQEKNSDLLSMLNEIFKNIEMIKNHSSEGFELKKFAKENWEFFKINMKAIYFNELSSPILEIIGALGLALVIYVGAKEVYASTMSVGEFMAFLTAIGLVFQPARGLGKIYTKMQDALVASVRVFEILDKEASIIDGKKELEKINKIEFNNVYLKYEDKEALKGIDFKVIRPKKIALVGESGGGKSSIINLILRFYDTSGGEILINDENIKNYTLSSLRKDIAIVSQRVYIFNDSIASNVAYGFKVDEKRVLQALKDANAYDFVKQMDDGMYTNLLEGGENLSGGQKQRLSLARALYKHASVLILDEATSALDNESEAQILETIDKVSKDKIIISIAHRLGTIKDYDEIYVVEDGKIVANGSHKDLIKTSINYQKLYEKSIKG